MSALVHLRERLVAGAPGAPVFAGAQRATPDAALNIQTYGGDPGEVPDANNLPLIEFVAFQVMARASLEGGQPAAEALAEAAYRILPGRYMVMGGVQYHWITANHRPYYVGVDQSGRPLVVVNFTARRLGPAANP